MDSQPESTAVWKRLGRSAAQVIQRPLTDFTTEPGRYQNFSFRIGDLTVDLSRQRFDRSVLDQLVELADARGVADAITRLLNGDEVNQTERRPAFHTGLRSDRPVRYETEIREARATVSELAADIRTGRRRGYSGKTLNRVVHIGIGGSHLGPELLCQALCNPDALPVTFLANVDGHAVQATLRDLDPERTLFIVASKSFSTIETLTNARTARAWFVERTAQPDAVASHFVAVSANVPACNAFGIDPANVLPIWDWVGGRYSVWSAVGLPAAISLGSEAFNAFLAGGRDMDEHFARTALGSNVPVLMALTDLWNINFLGATTHAIIPYDERLAALPAFLQQLVMESNGKRVTNSGVPVAQNTAPVIWGGVGTQVQHSFFQFLHQGTRAFAADLIVTVNPGHRHRDHRNWLLGSFLGQIDALVSGDHADDPHRYVQGGHPVAALLLDTLTPRALGQLIALYEHRTYALATLWGINPFDQWGVELGKRLAARFHHHLDAGKAMDHDLYAELRRQTRDS